MWKNNKSRLESVQNAVQKEIAVLQMVCKLPRKWNLVGNFLPFKGVLKLLLEG